VGQAEADRNHTPMMLIPVISIQDRVSGAERTLNCVTYKYYIYSLMDEVLSIIDSRNADR
jgi:hypothetical protein